MTDTEKLEFIKNAILVVSNKKMDILATDLLTNLGLDSLEVVELQMYYEEQTGHEMDPDVTVVTVGDMMKLMK